MRPSSFVRRLLFLGVIAAASAVFSAAAGYFYAVETAITPVGVMSAIFDVASDTVVFHTLSILLSPARRFFAARYAGFTLFIIPISGKTIPYYC